MAFSLSSRKHPGIKLSPWMVIGAAALLLIVVVILAVQNIDREKRYMSQILLEKGAALIKATEAGTRTGMMGMGWGGRQVQTLLEETGRQPDILYLVVTDGSGRVLAASDRGRVGRIMHPSPPPGTMSPKSEESWRLRDDENGRNTFEVYRYFRPVEEGHNMGRWMCSPAQMKAGRDDWCSGIGSSGTDHFIFVGLETAAFDEARREDIRNTIIISSVILLLGFGGFISLFWAQGYRAARSLYQDSSAFAEEVATYLPVGLIATDRDGRIAFFNGAASEITGIDPAVARGKTPASVFSSQWCPLNDLLTQEQVILEQEMECSFSERESVPLSVSSTRIINEEGDFVGDVLILRDLGEVRRLQEEVRRKEKMAALGGLAAGVAHEIRNPLSSIKGLASYFSGKFAEGSEDREAAGVMIREVDRLNRVITELLEFSRPSDLKCVPADLSELLNHSIRLIGMDASAKNIEIDLVSEPDLVAVLDPDRFSQCLLNLYLNAIQAMGGGGVLSVRSQSEGDREIRIEISDTGKGIPAGDLSKIFDPYFTSKPKGTGLGLAVVHKIIEAHRGDIKVKSTLGEGTVVTLRVPRQTDTGA